MATAQFPKLTAEESAKLDSAISRLDQLVRDLADLKRALLGDCDEPRTSKSVRFHRKE